MTKYSDGPFMNMKPAGAPGLIIVIFTVFAVSTLVTPDHWHPVLLVVALAAAGAVFVIGLHEALRPGSSSPQEDALALFRRPAARDGANQLGANRAFKWRDRSGWFGREAVIILVAAAITLVFVALFGPPRMWSWLVSQF
jgi:hypothetical protein